LQLTDLALQDAVFEGRHHLLAGAHRRERAFGMEPPPAEQLIGRNAVPACNQ